MAMLELSPTCESVISFCNEKWTAESARLLLELDEGWVGFHNVSQWKWGDATFDLFVVECQERQWACNSKRSCISMLRGLRSGSISMKTSDAVRNPQGFVQWSPVEMRALGWQMWSVSAGLGPIKGWTKQLQIFLEGMRAKDAKYEFSGRTIEDFKKRASKYLGEHLVKKLDDKDADANETASSVLSLAGRNSLQSKKCKLRASGGRSGREEKVSSRTTEASQISEADTVSKNSKDKAVVRPGEAVEDVCKAAATKLGDSGADKPATDSIAQDVKKMSTCSNEVPSSKSKTLDLSARSCGDNNIVKKRAAFPVEPQHDDTDSSGEEEWVPSGVYGVKRSKCEEDDTKKSGHSNMQARVPRQQDKSNRKRSTNTSQYDGSPLKNLRHKDRKASRSDVDKQKRQLSQSLTIVFDNEQWMAESARLLLELDEGWVGFHNEAQWKWNDATYDLFVVECQERRWPCKSKQSCISMLRGLRSGSVSMKISDAVRSPQGFLQWSPVEMRALGWQMFGIATGLRPVESWDKQLKMFMEGMRGKDPNYKFDDAGRTTEDFNKRASKYLGERLVKKISLCNNDASDTSSESSSAEEKLQRTNSGWRYVSRVRDSSSGAPKKLREVIAQPESLQSSASESAGNSSKDESIEDKVKTTVMPVELCSRSAPNVATLLKSTRIGSINKTATTNHENAERNAKTASPKRYQFRKRKPVKYDYSGSDGDEEWTPEDGAEVLEAEEDGTVTRTELQDDSPHKNAAQDEVRSPRTTGCKRGRAQRSDLGKQKQQRVQRSGVNSINIDPRASRTKVQVSRLNCAPKRLDPTAKPWSEFVTEVLQAEKTARNEDELDYVRFIRNLYDV